MRIIDKITDKYNVHLSDKSVSEFTSILDKKEYCKDEIILKQDQVSHYMYVVEEGIIRQFYYKGGRDITEHFSIEGDIATCIESLFLQQATSISIEAIEPSVIYRLDYKKWCDLCNIYSDINELYRRVLEYKLIVSQQKADSWRFESSSERYKRFCEEYPNVAKRASIAHIASYLLMTPETLSRVRSAVI